jgi:3-phosphoshikimate 1-carboxyvinyltransferase
MNLKLSKSATCYLQPAICIEGSKSETNRMLILQALYPNIVLENVSNADDCLVMKQALSTDSHTIDIHHSGTAMRFLTAYFAQKEGCEIVLTGSDRMQERPIEILVDALKKMGADIEYVNNYGVPPISIWGKKLLKHKISLPADVSSQYISALMLIAPKLENGLEIELLGEITSKPYLEMTLELLKKTGVQASFYKNIIKVQPTTQNPQPTTFSIESDWSSASYFYSIVALSEIGTEIKLSNFKQNSLQGDSILVAIYKDFGVETTFENESIILRKAKNHNPQPATYNLIKTPDLAQTLAVTCFGLEIDCNLSGLKTLKIKETDRLLALKTELEKLGATVEINADSLFLTSSTPTSTLISIKTYQDHRMAMAFAPLAIKFPIIIKDVEVVSKSYPNFWNDLKKIGFEITETV